MPNKTKPIALLVEDNPALQQLLGRWLKKVGVEVLLAADGQAALEKLQGTEIDIVCLDLMLPRVSGYQVCENVRTRLKKNDTPILVMSARVSPQDRAAAEEAGADAYLAKPLKEGPFVATVTRLLKRHASSHTGVEQPW